jgi:hypothetical protein
LAARWFAQEGLSVVELKKMVASSTIWTSQPMLAASYGVSPQLSLMTSD